MALCIFVRIQESEIRRQAGFTSHSLRASVLGRGAIFAPFPPPRSLPILASKTLPCSKPRRKKRGASGTRCAHRQLQFRCRHVTSRAWATFPQDTPRHPPRGRPCPPSEHFNKPRKRDRPTSWRGFCRCAESTLRISSLESILGFSRTMESWDGDEAPAEAEGLKAERRDPRGATNAVAGEAATAAAKRRAAGETLIAAGLSGCC